MVTCAVNLKYIIVKVYCEWLKKTEAETGIFSHGVSLNMVRDLFVGRGGYLKYTINISNDIKGLTINQVNYVIIL